MAAEFEPITTKEALDAAIAAAIKAEHEAEKTKYGGTAAELAKQLSTAQKDANEKKKIYDQQNETLQGLQKQVKGYESRQLKEKIAREAGLPYELAGRLSGDDEAALKTDAESLVKLLGKGKGAGVSPLANSEPAAVGSSGSSNTDGKAAAWRSLAKQLSNND